jgi:hypothetical protein
MTQFYSFAKKYPTTPPDAKATAEIISLAKAINAGTSGNHASKASWREVTKRLAEQDMRKGESPQQAFARFIQTPDGAELFKAFKSASGPDHEPPVVDEALPVIKSDSAYARLKKIAANLRAENPKLTEGDAFLKVFTDPANRQLAELSKREQAFA